MVIFGNSLNTVYRTENRRISFVSKKWIPNVIMDMESKFTGVWRYETSLNLKNSQIEKKSWNSIWLYSLSTLLIFHVCKQQSVICEFFFLGKAKLYKFLSFKSHIKWVLEWKLVTKYSMLEIVICFDIKAVQANSVCVFRDKMKMFKSWGQLLNYYC